MPKTKRVARVAAAAILAAAIGSTTGGAFSSVQAGVSSSPGRQQAGFTTSPGRHQALSGRRIEGEKGAAQVNFPSSVVRAG